MNARVVRRAGAAAASVAVLLSALAGCGSSGDDSSGAQAGTNTFPQASEPVDLNPADFSTTVDNPYFPLPVGARWVVRVTDQEGTVQNQVITVTDQTKRIANGVEARVVHDVVREDGEPVEITYDWYAQDSDGNVWYFGEDTAEYADGKVSSTKGSWEAGVGGARPGIVMLAQPTVGESYHQEYFEGEAEDIGTVVALDESVSVPYGSFDRVLVTEDTTPLEPQILEHKFYAPGIGVVLARVLRGGHEVSRLVSFTPPS
jgi:hypothetical protein